MINIRSKSIVARPWDRWMGLPSSRTIRPPLELRTADDVELVVHRFTSGAGRRKATPVMLLHGLCANRQTFSFRERSLADYLSNHGFDCYVPELRGAGRSEYPSSPWDFQDYLEFDVPAILDGIRDDAQQEQVQWVGHSMGGILLLAYLIDNPENAIASGFAFGSALDYSHGANAFNRLQHLMPLLTRIRTLPWGSILHWLSPAVARLCTPIESFNFSMDNIEPALLRRAYANAFEPIPTRLLESLATTFEARGLRNRDGTSYYREQAHRVVAPMCMVGGSRDMQCPLPAVQSTVQQLTGSSVRFAPFGREYGHRADYGHFDLILGKYAPSETWPVLVDWLDQHG